MKATEGQQIKADLIVKIKKIKINKVAIGFQCYLEHGTKFQKPGNHPL